MADEKRQERKTARRLSHGKYAFVRNSVKDLKACIIILQSSNRFRHRTSARRYLARVNDDVLVIKGDHRSENRSRLVNVLWGSLIILQFSQGMINDDSKDIDPSLKFHYYRARLYGQWWSSMNRRARPFRDRFIARGWRQRNAKKRITTVQKVDGLFIIETRNFHWRDLMLLAPIVQIKFDWFLQESTEKEHIKIWEKKSINVPRMSKDTIH